MSSTIEHQAPDMQELALEVRLIGSDPWHLTFQEGGQYLIGRSYKAAVCVPFNDVSRKHACLRYEEGKLMLADMGSRNGTFLHNLPIDASKWVELELGDRFWISELVFTVMHLAPDEIEPCPLDWLEDEWEDARAAELEDEMAETISGGVMMLVESMEPDEGLGSHVDGVGGRFGDLRVTDADLGAMDIEHG